MFAINVKLFKYLLRMCLGSLFCSYIGLFFLSGCAPRALQPAKIDDHQLIHEASSEIKPISPDVPSDLESTQTGKGIIFGKADFQGVLKVEYVKVNILDESDPQKQYELLFGDTNEENISGWDVRPVEPHYFFLELPAGKYRISTISIPVGTTLATEETNISFEVENGTVIYLGTLKVTGTDQKIRFGGVPLLQPGFEYRVEIINEKEEAINQFNQQYPGADRHIQVKLMKAVRFQTF